MSFRSFLNAEERSGQLTRIKTPVSTKLEAAGVLKALDGKPVLFERVCESSLRVAGNVFPTKESVARYLGVETGDLLEQVIGAIDNPTPPERVGAAPCQQQEIDPADLDRLPLLFHCSGDGGRYISSGVVIARDRDHGQNADFHRMMQLGPNRLSVRVVANRHFDHFLGKAGKMPVAVCIGNGAEVLLGAATSVALGRDELEIANSLAPFPVVRASTFDAWIPADCEVVLEGTIDTDDRGEEGPFVDLTGTYDDIRREPVLTVTKITTREDPIWHALLPGALEHKLLMGMPREPTIFRALSRAGVRCLDVNINPGGCSWLHAIVKIDAAGPDDGRRALEAAFRGHGSLKHCFVVDRDVDIYDPLSVEWAMATRFQGDRDLLVIGRERGSSLDPSRNTATGETCKLGFDLTVPADRVGRGFEKAAFPEVNISDYLGGDKS